MVDCLSFTLMEPVTWHVSEPDPSQCFDDVDDSDLHFCPPIVLGYSFTAKKWGRLLTDQFAAIRWSSESFQKLVLPEQYKTLVQSLVVADRAAMIKDVISCKAGGSTIILHGNPGTGKTLTAEAAAEQANKPLMVVSAAELGRQAFELEAKLQRILDVCTTWGAVLLIDEADVYLEARAPTTVEHNSVVSVFLRLLESHQLVIFLTTNHIQRLDAAFRSRISVAIKYLDLDKTAQEEIWTRFLELADVRIISGESQVENFESASIVTKNELLKLAGRKMNGRYTDLVIFLKLIINRQIKNAVRTTQAVAAFRKLSMDYRMLTEVLDMIGEFRDFEGACTCQERKLGVFSGGDRGNYLQDMKAGYYPKPSNFV